MKISILTVFDQLYQPFLATSLINRAQENKVVSFDLKSFCSVAQPKERMDRPTCGPSAGMVIAPEIVSQAIDQQEATHGAAYKIFFSPQGKPLDQRLLATIYTEVALQKKEHIMLLAARYEGMDARVEQVYADCVISLGNFVLMGGDLPAMVFLEGFLRLIPGVVGKAESVVQDSYQGPFVDYPEYCLPVEWKGLMVPDIIRSGNHGAIKKWRRDQAAKNTVLYHFEWLRTSHLNKEDKKLAQNHIPSHYVVLMHSQVLVGPHKENGTTSVTSLDLHDIARSARTYGLKGFFIVTPLLDQQKIVRQLLDFWKAGQGIEYNPSRHEAVRQVFLYSTLEEVVAHITQKEEAAPIVMATSAQHNSHAPAVTFYDQEMVWKEERPVLIMLGTGRGMSDELIAKADYLLLPVHGFSDYNHLSVRSAAAIIFDRWLGINEKNTYYPLAE